jgi:hypothetical protein
LSASGVGARSEPTIHYYLNDKSSVTILSSYDVLILCTSSFPLTTVAYYYSRYSRRGSTAVVISQHEMSDGSGFIVSHDILLHNLLCHFFLFPTSGWYYHSPQYIYIYIYIWPSGSWDMLYVLRKLDHNENHVDNLLNERGHQKHDFETRLLYNLAAVRISNKGFTKTFRCRKVEERTMLPPPSTWLWHFIVSEKN